MNNLTAAERESLRRPLMGVVDGCDACRVAMRELDAAVCAIITKRLDTTQGIDSSA